MEAYNPIKYCTACSVSVDGNKDFCPLCGTTLEPAANPQYPPAPNLYPDLARVTAQYNFIKRLFLFLSILGTSVSLLVNLLVPTGFFWSLIVIAAVLYGWITIPPILRRGKNVGSHLFWQVLFTSLLVVALDIIIGYSGWSVNYAVPGLLSVSILATCLIPIFYRTNWAQYVLSQVFIGIFGFLPLFLYLLDIVTNLVMVLVTAGLALASLLLTLVFADRSIKSEFKRRFHF